MRIVDLNEGEPPADVDEFLTLSSTVLEVSRGVVHRLHHYLETHGSDSLDMALTSGHLFDSDMRAASRLALQHSGDYVKMGAPCSVVIQLAPGAKKAGEKTSISLVTGPVQMTLDFPNLRSA